MKDNQHLKLTSHEKGFLTKRFDVLQYAKFNTVSKDFFQGTIIIHPEKMNHEKAVILIQGGLNIIANQLEILGNRADTQLVAACLQKNTKPTSALLCLVLLLILNIFLYKILTENPPKKNDLIRELEVSGCVLLSCLVVIGLCCYVPHKYYTSNKNDDVYVNDEDIKNLHKLIDYINLLYPSDSENRIEKLVVDEEASPILTKKYCEKISETHKKVNLLKENFSKYSQIITTATETSSLVTFHIQPKKNEGEICELAAEFTGIDLKKQEDYEFKRPS